MKKQQAIKRQQVIHFHEQKLNGDTWYRYMEYLIQSLFTSIRKEAASKRKKDRTGRRIEQEVESIRKETGREDRQY